MESQPFQVLQDAGPALEARFTRLTNTWREERGPSSSVAKFVLHPAYQRIIGLGPPVVSLILRELRREPDHWFWALRSITGEDPVLPEHAGDLVAMAQDWLKWGEQKGYTDDPPRHSALPQAG